MRKSEYAQQQVQDRLRGATGPVPLDKTSTAAGGACAANVAAPA